MQKLFNQIETLVPQLGNWCSVKKACSLAAAIVAFRPAVTLEIGVFSGASFLPMALAHQYLGHGMAIAIDPWSNQASVEGQHGANAKWWSECDHEAVYKSFMANRARLNLIERTVIQRCKSDDAVIPENIGLLHIDGNHGPQAIEDVARYAPHVTPGGIVWMDDMNWEGGDVLKAADNLMKMGFIKLYDEDTGTVFQRVKT